MKWSARSKPAGRGATSRLGAFSRQRKSCVHGNISTAHNLGDIGHVDDKIKRRGERHPRAPSEEKDLNGLSLDEGAAYRSDSNVVAASRSASPEQCKSPGGQRALAENTR